jgi:hypothetical protein
MSGRRRGRLAVLLGVALALHASVARGQGSSGAAAIGGTVRDESGAVIPGVTVEAASDALIERTRTAVADGQGQYRIVELPPGDYTVTFSLSGFQTIKRENIRLTANFTAQINADMHVGSLQETVTVSGGTPLVDVQGVVVQQVITRDLLDNVPTNKSLLAFAALTPALIVPTTAQDVGGSKGEFSVRMTVHGGKPGDQRLLQDGMNYNSMEGGGTGRGFFINPASASEFTIEQGAGSAEYSGGGININLIPKTGGNKFEAYFFTNYTNHNLQANNLSASLISQGLTAVNGVNDVYEVNGAVGGPLKKDRLWFFTAHRHWGGTTKVANVFINTTQGTPFYTPDLNHQAVSIEHNQSDNIRFTWQPTQKNKFTFSEDWQHNCSCQVGLASGGIAAEAVPVYLYGTPNFLTQGTWQYPASNRLLLEAGGTVLQFTYPRNPQPGASDSRSGQGSPVLLDGPNPSISILEQSTAFRFNSASNGYGDILTNQQNWRFLTTFTTGTHSIKAGVQMKTGQRRPINEVAGNVNYTFNHGIPVSLTEYATPVTLEERLKADLGLFIQDQFTYKRLTVTPGLRFEYLNAYNPPQSEPGNQFIGPRTFAATSCLPCWTDLNPRLSANYDLTGDGKTALKGSIGRYVLGSTVEQADTYNPANVAISTNRTWKDANNNFVPDCDLANPLSNGECGPLANNAFLTGTPNTVPDPAIENGFGKRGYDWQLTASLQRQLFAGVAAFIGYYRTWYGNFTVTDNLLVTPADYDPYCITAPVDSRLPGGGGNQICGLYDLNPSKVGQVNNLVTFASKYGKQTEVYSGVDVNITAHLPHNGELSGGANIGNAYFPSNNLTTNFSATSACFVVDSPQQLYQCEINPPYLTRLKLNGSYPLPWNLMVSAVFQSIPGPGIFANYTVTSAQTTLTRALTTGTATIPIIQPASQFAARINQMDLRIAKKVQVGGLRFQGSFDLYNLFNRSTPLVINNAYGASWQQPTQIMDGRLAKFGLEVTF